MDGCSPLTKQKGSVSVGEGMPVRMTEKHSSVSVSGNLTVLVKQRTVMLVHKHDSRNAADFEIQPIRNEMTTVIHFQ